jgi:hypothetical protein
MAEVRQTILIAQNLKRAKKDHEIRKVIYHERDQTRIRRGQPTVGHTIKRILDVLLENDVQPSNLPVEKKIEEAIDDLNSKRRRTVRPVSGAATASANAGAAAGDAAGAAGAAGHQTGVISSAKKSKISRAVVKLLWVLQNHCLPRYTADGFVKSGFTPPSTREVRIGSLCFKSYTN